VKTCYVAAAALLIGAAIPAHAGTLFTSGPAVGTDGYCDSVTLLCGTGQYGDPSTAWTIYSMFSLGQDSVMTGASYGNYFADPANYVSTNWSIWTSDPRISYAAGPAFSGNSVGVLSDGPAGSVTVTISGLDIALASGIYYFGFQNVVSYDSLDFYAKAHPSDFDSSQSNQLGTFYNPDVPRAAFTIDGIGGVPEPATWLSMVAGFGLIGAALRNRSRIAISFA
jgi:hypothetical protein